MMNLSIALVNFADSGLFETNKGHTFLDPDILTNDTIYVFEGVKKMREITSLIIDKLEKQFFPPNMPDLSNKLQVVTFLLDDGDLLALYKFPKPSRKACEIAALHFGCKLVNKEMSIEFYQNVSVKRIDFPQDSRIIWFERMTPQEIAHHRKVQNDEFIEKQALNFAKECSNLD